MEEDGIKMPAQDNNSVGVEAMRMYKSVCDGRFTSINTDLREALEDTKYLRAKIDNGLSTLPDKVDKLEARYQKQLSTIFLGGVLPIILLILGGAGFWLYSFGKLEQKMDNHIERTEQLLQVQAAGDEE